LLYVEASQVRLNPGREHAGPTPKGYEMSIAPQLVGHERPPSATAVAARNGTTSGRRRRTAMVEPQLSSSFAALFNMGNF
jgi:hypothetical protein